VQGARFCLPNSNGGNVALRWLLDNNDVGGHRFRCAGLGVLYFVLSFSVDVRMKPKCGSKV
jgi:hypothetical protein